MSTESERPWWSYTKDEQKRRVEDAVDRRLALSEELTDRQKLLLRNSLGHAYRGLLGLATQDLYDLSLAESAWSETARVDAGMVEGLTPETLRKALAVLRATPVQMRPVFM